MSFGPVSRPDIPGTVPSLQEGKSNAAGNSWESDSAIEITKLARTITNAGGGPLSIDLALDLLLNEVVEQAREGTRATGAAVALARDDRMTCRATSGNAPNLGTPVETESGLSAACLKTNEVQLCLDTEQDPRVDREACRHLDLRSMLLVPIFDGRSPCGILEVFSSAPNGFGDADVKKLQFLAKRIVTAKVAAEKRVEEKSAQVETKALPEVPPADLKKEPGSIQEPSSTPDVQTDASIPVVGKPHDILTSALVVLVIAAAVLLGIIIGVRQTAKHQQRHDQTAATVVRDGDATQAASSAKDVTSVPQPGPPPAAGAAPRPRSEVPVGGLIVTEKGKVIYRAGPEAGPANVPNHEISAAQLIHRVDPQYPEAAKSERIQGAVVLDAQVLGDGSVGTIAVVQGDPVLAAAATEAVKQWKYQPYIVEGQATERQERITIKFTLPPG